MKIKLIERMGSGHIRFGEKGWEVRFFIALVIGLVLLCCFFVAADAVLKIIGAIIAALWNGVWYIVGMTLCQLVPLAVVVMAYQFHRDKNTELSRWLRIASFAPVLVVLILYR